MLQYLRDLWESAQLRARYRRLMQEQLLELAETKRPTSVPEEGPGWTLVGETSRGVPLAERAEIRRRARQLVQTNPYARNLLRLLEVYVAGPGLRVTAVGRAAGVADAELLRRCDRIWTDFLHQQRRHFSFSETARRLWRDGEFFLRLSPRQTGSLDVRYVDPEGIGPSSDDPENEGIITAPGDVETVVAYRRLDPVTGQWLEDVPVDEMLHGKLNADTNEQRGLSMFASLLESLASFDKWIETELQARKLQSSIVLWRKVQGSPSQVSQVVQAAASGTRGDPASSGRRERYKPGTIITTSHGTDLQFLHPDTNFADAVPLGRMLLLGIAAGSGLPEFMVTSDASNGSYSSTMVAEGPAVKLFECEQHRLADLLTPLWWWVLKQASWRGELPPGVCDLVALQWTFPALVNRDRARERLADKELVEAGILSRAEVARRDNVDPDVMAAERAREAP